ncbi:MAG: hypothetical protein ACRDOH_24130 [Streptosporangiaceae bacterium]
MSLSLGFRFPQIAARPPGLCQRSCTALDCADAGFRPGRTPDQLPRSARPGASRAGTAITPGYLRRGP